MNRISGKVIGLLLAIACAGSTGCHSDSPRNGNATDDSTDISSRISVSQTALGRGIRYLLDQQGDDGLWHSPNYGNLKDGAAVTAFVLFALHDQDVGDYSDLQRAVDRLSPVIRRRGYVTNPDGPDYSNYGSAMLLLACESQDLKLDEDVRKLLIDYLVRSQLDAEEGFDESMVDHGGWDLSGWMKGKRPTTGTTISVSTSTLQALHRYPQHPGVQETLAAAENWIHRLQNLSGDGGFFFHPRQDHDGNKAGWADGNDRQATRSYGTATADGLRILDYLNVPADAPRRVAAQKWLQDHPDLDLVPGFDHESGTGSWGHGLRFYYYQTLAQALELLAEVDARRMATTIIQILEQEQKDDGHWSNDNARMREDDPLIATGFAVIALSRCQTWLDAHPE